MWNGISCKSILLRLYSIGVGLTLLVIGILGRGASGKLSVGRRSIVFVGSLFFLYCGLMYYFPKYRRKRRELDQLIRELEESERQKK